MLVPALALLSLFMLQAALALASCVPFSGSSTGAAQGLATIPGPGKQVHVLAAGVPGFGAQSISYVTGTGADVVVTFSGNHSATVPWASISIDTNGNLVINITTTSASSGATAGASVLHLATAIGVTSAIAGGKDSSSSGAILMACGLLSSAAVLTNGACTLTLSVAVTMPAGLTLQPLSGAAPTGSMYYTIISTSTSKPSAASTGSPVTTNRPTTHVPTHQPTANPTKKGQTHTPSSSPSTKSPTSSSPTYRPTSAKPSASPHAKPSAAPTSTAPTRSPTKRPTAQPTRTGQTYTPSKSPTSMAPTKSPTRFPSKSPTRSPTRSPGHVNTTITTNSNFIYTGCWPKAASWSVYFGSVNNQPTLCSYPVGSGGQTAYINCIIDPAMSFATCASLVPTASYIALINSTTCMYSTMGFDLYKGLYIGSYLGQQFNSVTPLVLPPQSKVGCTQRCAGNVGEVCGGSTFANIYVQKTSSPTASPTQSPTSQHLALKLTIPGLGRRLARRTYAKYKALNRKLDATAAPSSSPTVSLATLETYVAGILTAFSQVTVVVDSMYETTAGSWVVIYHYVSTPVKSVADNIAQASQAITTNNGQGSNPYGISKVEIAITASPSKSPTGSPSNQPSLSPTRMPTKSPSVQNPTGSPTTTKSPSTFPTTLEPTQWPTTSVSPTSYPTTSTPTAMPSGSPLTTGAPSTASPTYPAESTASPSCNCIMISENIADVMNEIRYKLGNSADAVSIFQRYIDNYGLAYYGDFMPYIGYYMDQIKAAGLTAQYLEDTYIAPWLSAAAQCNCSIASSFTNTPTVSPSTAIIPYLENLDKEYHPGNQRHIVWPLELYLGCYDYLSVLANWTELATDGDSMTLETCAAQASSQSLTYWGVTGGITCLASNDSAFLSVYSTAEIHQTCSQRCAGNSEQFCGSSRRSIDTRNGISVLQMVSVYQFGTAAPTPPTTFQPSLSPTPPTTYSPTTATPTVSPTFSAPSLAPTPPTTFSPTTSSPSQSPTPPTTFSPTSSVPSLSPTSSPTCDCSSIATSMDYYATRLRDWGWQKHSRNDEENSYISGKGLGYYDEFMPEIARYRDNFQFYGLQTVADEQTLDALAQRAMECQCPGASLFTNTPTMSPTTPLLPWELQLNQESHPNQQYKNIFDDYIVYVGCYDQLTSLQSWSQLNIDTEGMTLQSCAASAKAGSYLYWGVTSGTTCYASNDPSFVSTGAASHFSWCFTTCAGNSLQTCGAVRWSSIFPPYHIVQMTSVYQFRTDSPSTSPTPPTTLSPSAAPTSSPTCNCGSLQNFIGSIANDIKWINSRYSSQQSSYRYNLGRYVADDGLGQYDEFTPYLAYAIDVFKQGDIASEYEESLLASLVARATQCQCPFVSSFTNTPTLSPTTPLIPYEEQLNQNLNPSSTVQTAYENLMLYLGCYNFNSDLVGWTSLFNDSDSMTLQACATSASSNAYLYWGVTAGAMCYASNSPVFLSVKASPYQRCYARCAGNDNQWCGTKPGVMPLSGGPPVQMISVYQFRTASPTPPTTFQPSLAPTPPTSFSPTSTAPSFSPTPPTSQVPSTSPITSSPTIPLPPGSYQASCAHCVATDTLLSCKCAPPCCSAPTNPTSMTLPCTLRDIANENGSLTCVSR